MVFWVSLILHILRIDIIDYLNYNIDIFKSCVLLPVFGKWHGVPLFMTFSGVNHIAVIPLARAVFCVRRRQRQELVCQMHTVDWGDWVHTLLQMLSPANALIGLFSVALGHSSRWTIINRGWCFSFWEVIFLGECSVPVVWQSPQILQCSEGLHWRAHPVASHWAAAVHLEWVTLSNSQVTLIPQVFNKKAALPRQCKPGKNPCWVPWCSWKTLKEVQAVWGQHLSDSQHRCIVLQGPCDPPGAPGRCKEPGVTPPLSHRILRSCHDDASRFTSLLAKPGCDCLQQEDFIPLLQVLPQERCVHLAPSLFPWQ